MVDRDVILAKVGTIQRCLNRVEKVTELNPDSLDNNLDVQDIFVLNVQRAVQATLDLAAHIVADEGLGVPQELRENFDLLERNGILNRELSGRLRKMVGFRNIAVHEYESINLDILKSILQYNLRDLEECYMNILRYYDME